MIDYNLSNLNDVNINTLNTEKIIPTLNKILNNYNNDEKTLSNVDVHKIIGMMIFLMRSLSNYKIKQSYTSTTLIENLEKLKNIISTINPGYKNKGWNSVIFLIDESTRRLEKSTSKLNYEMYIKLIQTYIEKINKAKLQNDKNGLISIIPLLDTLMNMMIGILDTK
jgi:hypothetical protein